MDVITIELTDEQKAFVESQVATGQYVDEGDYVRDLIRSRQADVDGLRALIEQGDASGVSPRTPKEIFAAARESYRSRAA